MKLILIIVKLPLSHAGLTQEYTGRPFTNSINCDLVVISDDIQFITRPRRPDADVARSINNHSFGRRVGHFEEEVSNFRTGGLKTKVRMGVLACRGLRPESY